MDCLYWLEHDVLLKIFSSFGDPSDLVSISCVSRSWRHFVVTCGFCKKLCLKMLPQLCNVAHVVELDNYDTEQPAEVGSSNSAEWKNLEREHRVYALLSHCCTSFVAQDCISEAISASSTDNFADESISYTLEEGDTFEWREGDRFEWRASYWSSKGQRDPAVPETLIYKLISDFCIITEIKIQPFLAFFQDGHPIYSAKYVRFRMGHPKSPLDFDSNSMSDECYNDEFSWTYTSPIFQMTQENRLQSFQLPQSVLCIGGFLQIELLGRVQRQEMDSLFYICISHVQVKGMSLSPAFNVEVLEPSGKFVLKKARGDFWTNLPESKSHAIVATSLERRARDLQLIVNMLCENMDGEALYAVEDNSDEEFVL